MATFPLVPTIPTFPMNLDDDDILDEDTSDSDEDLTPQLNLDIFDDSDEEQDEEADEFNDSERNLAPNRELAQLLNLGKTPITFPTTPFPTTTQRVPAQPVTAPRPMVVPTVPNPILNTGIRLTLMPQPPPVLPNRQPQVTQAFPGPLTGLTLAPPVIIPTAGPLTGLTLAPPVIIPTGVPQLTVPIVAPPVPNPVTGLTLNPVPNIPLIAPLITQPTVPPLAAQPAAKTVDVGAILAKMPGVTVATITPPAPQVTADINDLLQKEADESDADFEARRRLTLLLVSIPDYHLNNATAVTAGHLMMKKSKLGVTYDPDVESAIAYLAALLQR